MATDQRLRAAPTQLIPTDEGVIAARGKVVFTVHGSRAYDALYRVLDACLAPGGSSPDEIVALFTTEEAPAVKQLLAALQARRILMPMGETGAGDGPAEERSDVFYWAMGVESPRSTCPLAAARIALIGLNGVSLRMAGALAEMGVANVETVDFPLLRNISLFGKEETPDLATARWPEGAPTPLPYDDWRERGGAASLSTLVATCDFGGHTTLREWNRYAVREKIPFLPVTVNRGIARVGPIVLQGDTPCLECLLIRENANHDGYASIRKVDEESFAGQLVSPVLPSMLSMAGDAATLELARFFDFLWLWRKGTAVDIDLVGMRIRHHRIYRIPRCPVCDTHRKGTTLDLKKDETGGDSGLVERLKQLSGVGHE